jgi:hypothetical protein
VKQALDWHTQGVDFADGLHLTSSASARQFATFDRALVKAAKRPTATSASEHRVACSLRSERGARSLLRA